MSERWPQVALGEVANLDVERVAVASGEIYRIAGVLNAGRGLFARDEIDGASTNYSVLHRLRRGQLVMRKLTAWEGPITVVPQDFDGYFVSSEFPTFTLDNGKIEPDFMRLVCQTPKLWEAMKGTSTGTVQRRKRVNPAALLAIKIDLPPLHEQRRIADLMRAVDVSLERAAVQGKRIRALGRSLRANVFEPRDDWERVRASDAMEITMGRQRSPKHMHGDHLVPYLRAANVKDGRLILEDVLAMHFTPAEQATFALTSGDVLVTEGCGSLSEIGASAQWHEEREGTVCFQNTLLRLRAHEQVTRPEFVHQWARWAYESGQFADIASGTNIFHIGSTRAASMDVPVPPLTDQDRLVASLVASDAVVKRAERYLEAMKELRRATLHAFLSATTEIGALYDRFLEEQGGSAPTALAVAA